MDKDIFTALKADKPKTLPVIEPFNSALAFHTILLFLKPLPKPNW
jgi:hypothetical protein